MLLGLDVLQDWEATIQIGGNARQSSITVKKRGMSEPVVLPFLVGDSSSIVVKVMVRIGGEGVVVVVVAEPLQLRLIMVNSSIRVEGIQNINNDMQLSKHIINMTIDDRLNNNATSNMTLPKMMKNKKKTFLSPTHLTLNQI